MVINHLLAGMILQAPEVDFGEGSIKLRCTSNQSFQGPWICFQNIFKIGTYQVPQIRSSKNCMKEFFSLNGCLGMIPLQGYDKSIFYASLPTTPKLDSCKLTR